jgi:hypothetical protein
MVTTNEVREAIATKEQWSTAIAAIISAEFEPRCRRSLRRYPADGEIKATYQVDDEPVSEAWDLYQVSLAGLSARSSREIPEGARLELEVHINGDVLRLRGKVRHCTQTLGGYKVGIEILFDE